MILVLGTGFLLAWAPLATLLGEFLIRDDTPVAADVAVVLGGDKDGIRTLTGARLVQQGFVPYALLSGPAILGEHESDLMLAYGVKHGFPASYFQVLPNGADSTRDEAKVFKEELRRRGIHRVLLVTSNFHSRRAYCLFHSIIPEAEIHTVAAPDPRFSPRGWWKSRIGQKTFFLEWSKTFATWLGD
jgi:uncharacterized SAM-binding protein YcdF (DUF218 family)